MIQFNNVCLVAELPSKLLRDERGMLHCDNAPAIEWRDGYKLYIFHGVTATEKIIMYPETITKEDIINEKNEEVRRVMVERIGAERFGKMMGFETVNEDNYGALLKTKIDEEIFMYAHVLCPSTSREYYLQVPSTLEEALLSLRAAKGITWEEWSEEKEKNIWPSSGKMETCKQACGWTFGKSELGYQPLIQT